MTIPNEIIKLIKEEDKQKSIDEELDIWLNELLSKDPEQTLLLLQTPRTPNPTIAGIPLTEQDISRMELMRQGIVRSFKRKILICSAYNCSIHKKHYYYDYLTGRGTCFNLAQMKYVWKIVYKKRGMPGKWRVINHSFSHIEDLENTEQLLKGTNLLYRFVQFPINDENG